MSFNCPACGAEVIFKSRFAVFAVCSFCSSTILKTETSLKNAGKMSELPPDLSPIQIGTSGFFKSKKFEVIGRQKINWENGYWNEWYLYLNDNTEAWLADAQGDFIFSYQQKNSPLSAELSSPSQLRIYQKIDIGADVFTVNDIRKVTCVGSQGELPILGVKDRNSTNIDLIGPNQKFASFEFSNDGLRFFLGDYVDFDSLNLTNLRKLDGW